MQYYPLGTGLSFIIGSRLLRWGYRLNTDTKLYEFVPKSAGA